MDVNLLDKKIDQMMPELGFMPQDNDRLVASYSGGWQMRMCLGKLLLQVCVDVTKESSLIYSVAAALGQRYAAERHCSLKPHYGCQLWLA